MAALPALDATRSTMTLSGMQAGQHMRVVLADILPERTVAIFLDDTGNPGFEALEQAVTPILESFVFSPTPPTP
jgi:hypothetical protein